MQWFSNIKFSNFIWCVEYFYANKVMIKGIEYQSPWQPNDDSLFSIVVTM